MKFLVVLCIDVVLCQLFISEVMFDLDGADSPNEFVEIYNASDSAYSLQNLDIADKYSRDQLYSDHIDQKIYPHEFAIIFEGDYNGFYDNILPESTVILYVDDSSIGNGLSKSDSLFLIQQEDTLSVIGWDGTNHHSGFSLERISFDMNVEESWMQSIDSLGTPGQLNSVHHFTEDMAIDSIFYHPEIPEREESFTLFIIVSNDGLVESHGHLEISNYTIDVSLLPSQLDTIIFEHNGFPSGINSLVTTLYVDGDYNMSNNHMDVEILVPFYENDVLINEIMFDPITNEFEWVELIAVANDSINLLGWSLQDDEDFDANETIIIQNWGKNNYYIVTDNSDDDDYFPHFPTLNNNGDDIFLFDPTGKVIDHVQYSQSWGGGDGYSLERISIELPSHLPSNWGQCLHATGASPLSKNSLSVEVDALDSHIYISPMPFSPNGDGQGDKCSIVYELPFTQATVDVIIYDSTGREIKNLYLNKHVAQQGIIVWDGTDNWGNTAPIGQYLVFISAKSNYDESRWEWIDRLILAK